MVFPKFAGFLLVPAFAAACATATPPPPPPIQGQPIFNKHGEQVGCEQGEYIPGAQQQLQCLPPPPENCDPSAVSYVPDCRQPGKDHDHDVLKPGGNVTELVSPNAGGVVTKKVN